MMMGGEMVMIMMGMMRECDDGTGVRVMG